MYCSKPAGEKESEKGGKGDGEKIIFLKKYKTKKGEIYFNLPLLPFSFFPFLPKLLLRLEFLRRDVFLFEDMVEHFGHFGAARGELGVGLFLLAF